MYFKSCLFLVALTTILVSCRYNDNKASIPHKSILLTHKANAVYKDNDMVIDFPCAVVVFPSDKAINKLKKSYSEGDYNTIIDDNLNYMDESLTYLDSVKTKKVERKSNGMIAFKTASGERYEVKLDTLSWAILLFNGKNKPIQADMTVFADNYQTYMK
ncbi:MAG: hypothetical protein ACHQF4_09230 [Sphingobacteriales bacterium]